MIRTLVAGALLAFVLTGTWWMVLGAGLLALATVSGIEVVAAGMLFDFLYAGNGYFGVYTGLFLLVYIVKQLVTRHLF